ncbi:MAG: serine hydrolase family protein [Candidatus Aenigmatarchaeota archaeon]|nr:MAG: serine hydrolase family protein [Candidatus Aenigmarchaeota archaeon]
MNVIIIHGAYGSPEENWLPWLKSELEKLGCGVFVPKFPTPENQSLGNWIQILDTYDKCFDSDLVMIGHSLGPALIFRKLETLGMPIKAAFLVAGFLGKIGDPDFDGINASFFKKEFEWEKIRKNCRHFEVFHSDNDPYVAIDHGKKIAENLGVDLTLVKGAGHFNTKAGYREFPLLLERIKERI